MQTTIRLITNPKRVQNSIDDDPKTFTCQFWEPGLVSYDDMKLGVALLKKETMDRIAPDFVGKPVIIKHQDGEPEDLFKSGAAIGKILEVNWNANTGWYDCTFTVENDEALRCIRNGWSVSCAFDSDDTGPGGEWHAIPYDFEITGGRAVHLALVPNPRYEDSRIITEADLLLPNGKIFINSKAATMVKETRSNEQKKNGVILKMCMGKTPTNQEKSTMSFFKGFFKRKQNNDAADPTKGESIEGDGSFVVIDGENVPLTELLRIGTEPAKPADQMQELSNESEIEHEGQKHKVGDLIEKYRQYKASQMQNAETPEQKAEREKKEADEKAKKENEEKELAIKKENEDKAKADDEAKKKEDEEKAAKQNEKKRDIRYFKHLNSLREEGDELKEKGVALVNTLQDKLSRGADRYGKKKS